MTIALQSAFLLVAGVFVGGVVNVSILLPIILAGVCLAAVFWLIFQRDSRKVIWLLGAACFFAGMTRGLQADVVPADDISRFIGKTVAVYGVIDAVPDTVRLDDKMVSVRYRIRVEAVKAGAVPEPAGGGLLATVRQGRDEPIYPYGAKVAANGPVKELHGYKNPGVPDMVASWRRQGYTARLSVAGPLRYTGENETGWRSALSSVRETMNRQMQAAMPVADAAILKGTVFGGYAGIAREVLREFAATGIIHILSVSGSHVALVAGVVHWLGGAMGWSSRPIALVTATAVLFYALLAGFSPPVIRSVMMGLITLFAAVWGREKDSVNALAVTAGVMLAFQPSLLYDISFQLSFGGTAGLVFLYAKTAAWLSALPLWLNRPLAATAAAQLGVLPVMSWYFNSLPLVSFAANLLVVPLIELTVVLGLAGGLLSLAFLPLGHLVFVFCSLFLSAARHVNSLLALFPLAVYLPPLGIIASAGYWGLLAWLYGYLAFLPNASYLLRRNLRLAVVTVFVLLGSVTFAAALPGPLSVHFIDVGQGDATLVITPRGRAVLIDTGGSPGGDFDIGERVVYPYLRRLHVNSLDCLILTHGHQDHAGGAAAIASLLPVAQVLLPPDEQTPAVERLLNRSSIPAIPALGQSFMVDGVQFSLLRSAMTDSPKRGGLNENSCVVEVRYGVHSFLITGDLEGQIENALLQQGLSRQTVLKVGHHGARTSSSASFLSVVNPQYAVISVGAGNRYGHPHQDTVNRLQAGGRTVFRTDKHGAVVFESDGEKLAAKSFIP